MGRQNDNCHDGRHDMGMRLKIGVKLVVFIVSTLIPYQVGRLGRMKAVAVIHRSSSSTWAVVIPILNSFKLLNVTMVESRIRYWNTNWPWVVDRDASFVGTIAARLATMRLPSM